jgi:hypothetical protein
MHSDLVCIFTDGALQISPLPGNITFPLCRTGSDAQQTGTLLCIIHDLRHQTRDL